ncbi:MAG: D-aminoacylase [Candidatus Magnetoovum sp. WYHC-5]|nr:D-aminoacylase [Candidatus Magnetoovum sp. WYHC-5]
MGTELDFLIKNATIYDGLGNKPFCADLGILQDKIVYIGRQSGVDAKTSIDATRKVLSPGFIDVHAHSEFSIFAYPDASSKVFQGVTTEINGNCGMSCSPIYGATTSQMEKEFTSNNISQRWATFDDYKGHFKALQPAVNFTTLTGHGNIRASVMGYVNEAPSEKQMEDMALLLKKSAQQGSLGLSTGLIYLPGVYSKTEELIELINRSGIQSLIYATHMRSEGDYLLESVNETIEIAQKTGIKIHISHLKTSGRHNWHKMDRVIEAMESAKANGIHITCDRYPYTASQTSLDAVLPPWVYEGGNEAEIERLKDKNVVNRLRNELAHTLAKRGEGNIDSTKPDDYWNSVMISRVHNSKNRHIEGKRLAELAEQFSMSPLTLLINTLIEEKLDVDAIYFSMSDENLRKVLLLDNCMIGSDSSLKGFDIAGNPHPRGFGTFAGFIRNFSVEKGLLPLETAIYKMTGLAASTFDIKHRGVIAKGAFADIVIFNPEEFKDMATYDNPKQKPVGLEHLFVNGVLTVFNNQLTGKRAGRVLMPPS